MSTETILIVDDEEALRELLLAQLGFKGFRCLGASSVTEALAIANREPEPAVVLSDLNMPGLSGVDLLERLLVERPNCQVIMLTGRGDYDTVRRCLRAGAYDYLVKPYQLDELTQTVERALDRRRLILEVQTHQRDLERRVEEKTREVLETRDIAFFAVAKLAECRDDTTGYHLERIQWYSLTLARQLRSSEYGVLMTEEFCAHLFKSSPLHDIGKVAIPDRILLKPDRLLPEEWEIMKTHTTRGGDTLREVIERQQSSAGALFLRAAMEIAYDHHERWDGRGYPAAKSGREISLGARIVAIADAYDAITSVRPYEGACPHDQAVERIVRDRGSHFDPVILDGFVACESQFALIQNQMSARAGLDSQTLEPIPPPAG